MTQVLYGAQQGVRAIQSEAYAKADAKTPHYHLRAGGLYLHFSATKLTDNRGHAWTGTVAQARACRVKFDAAAGCKLRSIKAIPPVEEMTP